MCEGANNILPQNWMDHGKNVPKTGCHSEVIITKTELQGKSVLW